MTDPVAQPLPTIHPPLPSTATAKEHVYPGTNEWPPLVSTPRRSYHPPAAPTGACPHGTAVVRSDRRCITRNNVVNMEPGTPSSGPVAVIPMRQRQESTATRWNPPWAGGDKGHRRRPRQRNTPHPVATPSPLPRSGLETLPVCSTYSVLTGFRPANGSRDGSRGRITCCARR